MTFQDPNNPRFQHFQAMMIAVQGDAEASARFNAEVTTARALVDYSAAHGVTLSEPEAQGIFEAVSRFAEAQGAGGEGQRLSDTDLEAVNGGLSWAAVGGLACGIVGAVGGIAIAIATAPISIPLGTAAGLAALVGTAVVGGGSGAFSGAVFGAMVGGGAQAAHDAITS
ncbi:hypothetical protein [Methylobacterium sp. Leaf118]|uniref:hypothetical protein n=1 Tax=Methylobacterium sp. Leaf118 TaxID=2876562 RepID=UPI001E57CCA7|nr:hypothetical protein [Methylobacterium sp. Leaf118]